MQIATRIDFARSQAIGTDARIIALAIASGIAGLSVTYPTVTVGNGTVSEWMGRLEVKAPRLTMPAISPDMSITAKFQNSAQTVTDAVKAGAAGLSSLSNALTPEITSLTGIAAAELTSLATPEIQPGPFTEGVEPVAHLASSKSSARSSEDYAPAIKARLPRSFPAPVVSGPAEPVAPLDAVRIALPPASTELSVAGAMPPEATLARIAAASPASPIPAPVLTPVPVPDAQSLAASTQPKALAVATPGAMPETPPVSLFSASREVREFDLAKLGSTKAAAKSVARASIDVLVTAQATSRSRDLPKVAKVPDRVVGDHIMHVAGLSLEGVPSGNLSVRIGMSGDLSVKLADLLVPVQDQMAPATFERLANSTAAAEYVSFADLRSAGFDIRYDAGNDRLLVSAQP